MLLGLVALLQPLPVLALGLGELRTQSALNQPFYGEIDLFEVDTNALDSVKASLASQSAFEQAGLERPYSLTRLQFTPMIGPRGEPMIQVITREPIREPYLDLLVEVVWPDGRLVKEYAVLLDPPAAGGERVARAAPPPRRSRPVQSPLAAAAKPSLRGGPPSTIASGGSNAMDGTEPAKPSSRAALAVAPDSVEIPAAAAELDYPIRYGPVPSGAGLVSIARSLAPPGATLEQTMMALYRNSQDAFLGGDINRLRLGAELVIPTAAELFAIGPSVAREHYRAALAGRPVVKAPLTDQTARLTIATPTAKQAVAADDDGPEDTQVDLEVSDMASGPASATTRDLSPPQEVSQADPTLEPGLLVMQEPTQASREEAAELRARVKELEGQLDDIGRLLELRNAQLASLAATGAATSAADLGSVLADGSEIRSAAEVQAQADADDETRDTVGIEPEGQAGAEVAERGAQVAEPRGTASEAEAADAAPETSPVVATSAKDPGSEPIGEVDSTGALSPWRQAMPVWVWPLVAVAVLVALLGLMVLRRKRQASGPVSGDAGEAPSGEQIAETQPLSDDLQLDADWPVADRFAAPAANATATKSSDVITVDDGQVEPSWQGERLEQGAASGDLQRDNDAVAAHAVAAPQRRLTSGSGDAPEPEAGPASRTHEWVGQAAEGLDLSAPGRSEQEMAASDTAEQPSDQGASSGRDDRSRPGPADGQAPLNQPSTLAPAAGNGRSAPDQDASSAFDALAEADVYLTYGRYRDAERVLRDTMADAGESPDLRYKLAETYLAAGDRGALALLADKMRLSGDPELGVERWRRVEEALGTRYPEQGMPEREAPKADASIESLDDEPLFLDLDALEQVTEPASSQPSALDRPTAEVSAPNRDQDRLQLDLAALSAMTNDELAHYSSSEPVARSIDTDLPAGPNNAGNLELPTIAGLSDEPAEPASEPTRPPALEIPREVEPGSDGQLQVQGQTQTLTEFGDAATLVSSPEASEGSGDERSGLASTEEASDERWSIDSGEGWDEVGLKLDLARAYLDMEDPDAAVAILKEVVAEGGDEQRREAEALLAGLG